MTEYKPYSGSEPYIFVSYAHKDQELVMPVIEQMQQDGYRVWYDEGIDPGTEWDENIAIHVDKCFYFVAFLSDNYLQSENCKDELNYARDQTKKRLLIYLENIELPRGMAMRLNRLQAIHKYTYTTASEFYTKLYQSNEILVCRGDVPAAIESPVTTPPEDFVIIDGLLFAYNGDDTVVHVPEGVRAIGDSAFMHCERLTSVHLPDSLTSIGARAFWCCKQLSSVHFPDSLTNIGAWVFWGCKQLSSIVIPKSVRIIGPNAFALCKSLKKVYLSRHTEVYPDDFKGCHPDLRFIFTD